MIDTHAHLERLCDIDNNIKKIVLAASKISDSLNNLSLGIKHPDIFLVAIGIHPQECGDSPAKLREILKDNSHKISAIGECGLEFIGDYNKNKQKDCFIEQIKIAEKYKKPLIIHARKAVDETIEILSDYEKLSGVFHCYAGGNKRIKKVLSLGKDWYFGIDGNVTYEMGLEEVVKNIPKDRLVLETDSPYLSPEPYRGQVNNPNNIIYVYKKIAEIWGMRLEETEKIIDANAKKLFLF